MTTKNKTPKNYSGHEVVIVREFACPRETVFKAWTDPAQVAQWWGPKGFTNPVCEWSARPGGAIYVVMRAPNGDEYPMAGTFHEVAPPERLVFTSGALDEKKNLLFELVHTITFVEKSGKTTVTVRSKVGKTTATAGKYLAGYEAGMTQSLERLAALVTQTNGPVVIERTFDVPVTQVWKAITTKKTMKEWYFDVKEFDAKVGFSFEFSAKDNDGVSYLHRCKITEVIPKKKIAYTWGYEGHEGQSLVTFELFPEGNKTRLKLTHEGLETFPKTAAFARTNFLAGWTFIIGSSLKNFFEGKTGNTADREIISTRVFDAPRELIWEAWTNPDHLIHWWGPHGFTNTFHQFEFKVGGMWRYTMHGPDGRDYKNEMSYVEITKPERIVIDHVSPPRFRVTATFEKQGGKTKITFHQVFQTVAEYEGVKKYAIPGNEQNFDRLAARLKQMI